MKQFGIALLDAFSLAGCTTVKNWSATGGSRADGVVRMSYKVGEMEKAQLNDRQAIDLTTQRCNT